MYISVCSLVRGCPVEHADGGGPLLDLSRPNQVNPSNKSDVNVVARTHPQSDLLNQCNGASLGWYMQLESPYHTHAPHARMLDLHALRAYRQDSHHSLDAKLLNSCLCHQSRVSCSSSASQPQPCNSV